MAAEIDRWISNAGQNAVQSALDTYDLSTVIDGTWQTWADSPLLDGESTWVRVRSLDSDKWEVMEAQFSAGTDQFTRVQTIESSAADAAVDFGSENLQIIGSVLPGQKVVPNGRIIATGAGLAGGGDLTADRTLAADITGAPDLGASVAGADEVLVADASDGAAIKKTTAQDIAGLAPVATELSDLSDVAVTTPAAGEVLIYDATAGQFENAPVTAGNGIAKTEGDASLALAVDIVTGGGLTFTSGQLEADEPNIDHDALSGFVANEHVDHSGVTLTAGTGLSGGGDLTASRSFSVDNYASLARLDLGETVTGAWTFSAELIANGGIDTNDAGPLSLAATNNADQLNLRTDGNVAMSGSLKVGGTGAAEWPLDVRGGIAQVYRESTASAVLFLRSNVSALGGVVARAEFDGHDSAGNQTTYGQLSASVQTNTDGAEDGRLIFEVAQGGTLIEAMLVDDSGATFITTPNAATGTTLVTAGAGLNEIKRDSSTRRHKTDIAVAEIDPARVLAIDPVTYKRDGSPEVGFIAEDFEQGVLAHGLGYDEQGRVHGFLAGSRVIDAAQQVVLQDHEARLQALEEKIQ